MLDSMSSCFITSTNLKYQPLFIYLFIIIYLLCVWLMNISGKSDANATI